MRRIALALVAAIAVTALAGWSAAPARAGNAGITLSWHSGYGYPAYRHKQYYKHHKRKHNYRHFRPKRRHYYRHRYSDGRWGNHYYRSYGHRPCHPVYRNGYWHGRPAKLGGTMCYGNGGHSYVVRGSEYVIHFY